MAGEKKIQKRSPSAANLVDDHYLQTQKIWPDGRKNIVVIVSLKEVKKDNISLGYPVESTLNRVTT